MATLKIDALVTATSWFIDRSMSEGQTEFKEIELPSGTLKLCANQYLLGNVAGMYNLMYEDLINDTHKASDFDYAVEIHAYLIGSKRRRYKPEGYLTVGWVIMTATRICYLIEKD